MQSLNDEVEAGRATRRKRPPIFSTRHGGLHVDARTESRTQLILRHLLEHLDLVRRSLLPAIVVGVALGILSASGIPRIGRVVLAAVGLLQTIPSLALLVLLLPLVAALGYRSIGEGSVTAVTALFCYCLLPIVRNTYTGLDGIPRGTIESATVLGLGPLSRLVGDRASDRPADDPGGNSHVGGAERRLRDAGRHHRRGRIGPADSARNPTQRPVADSGRAPIPAALLALASASVDRRHRMGGDAARFETRSGRPRLT